VDGAPTDTINGRAVWAALLPVAAGVLPAFLVGALAVQIRADLEFTEAGLGLVTGSFFAGAAFSSVPLGRTAERIGAVRALRASALGSGLVLLTIAAAGRSFGLLVVLLAVAGMVNALVQPAANLFLVRAVSARRLGLAFGIKQSAIPAGGLFGGLAVPAIALTVGWRWAFVAAAGLALAAAAGVPDDQPEAPTPVDPDPTLPSVDAPRRITIAFAVGACLAAAGAGVLGTFLVSGAVEVGLADATAGLLAAGGSAVSIGARLLLGVRADRVGTGHLRVVAGMLVLGAGGFVLLASGGAVAFVVGTPIAFGLSWAWPGLFNLAMVRHHPQAPAAATGITQTGVYVGAVGGPLVFGLVAEGGYGGAWLLAGTWSVAAGLLIGGARALLVRHRAG
jgi:MFS family permease